MAYILETIMLICFGFSWPINLMKAYRARTAKGTSLTFLLLIELVYIAGIMSKIISGNINYVLAVYLLNFLLVALNLAVYARNVRLDKQSGL